MRLRLEDLPFRLQDQISAQIYKGKEPFVCLQCNTPFTAYPSTKRKFCSLACAYKNEARVKNLPQTQKKVRPPVICKNCSREFIPITNKGKVFCSKACCGSHLGKSSKGRIQTPNPRTKYEQIACKNCGKTFGAWKAAARKFCSQECAASHPETRKQIVESFNAVKNRIKIYSRAKKGWVELGARRFFARSSWEANYGKYLEFLRTHGEISDWEHEPHTFWFEGIKRGCISYLPDFKVTKPDGSHEWHEVKGWMDNKSKTKIARMGRYHPEEKLIIIDAQRYRSIAKTIKHLIPDWT